MTPTGPIRTIGPNGRRFPDWSRVTRWLPEMREANAAYPVVPVPLLAAMIAIESDGNPDAYRAGDGYDDVPAEGLMQVKWRYHAWRIPGMTRAEFETPAGNVRLGAKIVADGVAEHGTWQRALTRVFFPGDDENGTTQGGYVRTARDLMAEWGGEGQGVPDGYKQIPVEGSAAPVLIPADIPFRVQITPLDSVARPNDRRPGANRSGKHLNYAGVTQHETGNRRADANAAMHANWQGNGTPGHPDGKIGVHFYADDREIVQCIPVNEQGVHSGDWRNAQHVAIELCVNAGRDAAKAERHAKELCAALLRARGLNAEEHLYPHRSGSGCPAVINARGGWSAFERDVEARTALAPGTPKPSAVDVVVKTAEAQVGKPYRWASAGPDTFDCSGLTSFCLGRAGLAVSRDSHAQFTLGTPVDRAALQPGDLLFYDTAGGGEVREGNRASHVGIYVAPGKMINALNESAGVVVSDPFSSYFEPLFLGARRLLQPDGRPIEAPKYANLPWYLNDNDIDALWSGRADPTGPLTNAYVAWCTETGLWPQVTAVEEAADPTARGFTKRVRCEGGLILAYDLNRNVVVSQRRIDR